VRLDRLDRLADAVILPSTSDASDATTGQCNSRCLRQTSQGQSRPVSLFCSARWCTILYVPDVPNLRQELQKFTAPGRSWTEVLTLKTLFGDFLGHKADMVCLTNRSEKV
jgi:hypothetical protein